MFCLYFLLSSETHILFLAAVLHNLLKETTWLWCVSFYRHMKPKKSQISLNGNPVLLFNWSWNISVNHVATKICKAALCFSLWIRMIFWYKVFMSMIVVISIHLVWLSQKYKDIFFYILDSHKAVSGKHILREEQLFKIYFSNPPNW